MILLEYTVLTNCMGYNVSCMKEGILMQLYKWIKEKLLLIVFIVLLLLVIIGAYKGRYQPFEKEFTGIEFHLNEKTYTERLLIFDGILSDPLIGTRRFEGRIIYDEEVYETNLIFKNNRDYILTFDGKNRSEHELTEIFIDDDFKEITITIYEKTSPTTTTWNSTNGLVFVAPASSVSEGYKIFDALFDR